MSLIAILIPFAFVAYPSLLGFPNIGWQGLAVCASLMIATGFWGASIYGVYRGRRLPGVERMLLLLVPLCFVILLIRQQIVLAIAIFIGSAVFLVRHAYAVKPVTPVSN